MISSHTKNQTQFPLNMPFFPIEYNMKPTFNGQDTVHSLMSEVGKFSKHNRKTCEDLKVKLKIELALHCGCMGITNAIRLEQTTEYDQHFPLKSTIKSKIGNTDTTQGSS